MNTNNLNPLIGDIINRQLEPVKEESMSYKKTFKKREGNLIWFGGSEETCDLTGIVVGYNNDGCILAVQHGLGDYCIKESDIIPNKMDLGNPKGYVVNDLDAIEFED